MEEHFHPKITTREELEKMISSTACVRFSQISNLPKKIIAIGDVHGDFEHLFTILNRLKIIDEDNNWIGGDTIVVQTGDVLDDGGRGYDTNKKEHSADEIAIYNLLINLNNQANKLGGAVLMCIGNHEIINILENNVDYVNLYTKNYYSNMLNINRQNIITIGSEMAKKLSCVLKSVIKIGDIYFCHGGISYKLYNDVMRSNNWETFDRFIEHLNRILPKILNGNIDRYAKELEYIKNISWNRDYGDYMPNEFACMDFEKMFRKEEKLVIGHTVQPQGINSICNNRIFRIDTAISRAFGDRYKLEALEIINCRDFYRISILPNEVIRRKLT
jgi:Icc-related predicted phosphoesterase